MMCPKISIIIPIFNAEKYLWECLQSVSCQSEKSFEVICIDDGSSDNSLSICKQFQQQSSFPVTCITHENRGLSAARNEGIDLAQGDYILFLDADDVLVSNACHQLSSCIANHSPELVLFMYQEKTRFRLRSMQKKLLSDYESVITNPLNKLSAVLLDGPMVWKMLYSRDLLNVYSLRFIINIFYEDYFFTIAAALSTSSIHVLNHYLYLYRIRRSSICHKQVELRHINGFLASINGAEEFARIWHFGDDIINFIKEKKRKMFYFLLARLPQKEQARHGDIIRRHSKLVMHETIVEETLKNNFMFFSYLLNSLKILYGKINYAIRYNYFNSYR